VKKGKVWTRTLEGVDVVAAAALSATGRHAKEEHIEDLLWRDLVFVEHEVCLLRVVRPAEPHPAATATSTTTEVGTGAPRQSANHIRGT
jgi:hypothetical protein